MQLRHHLPKLLTLAFAALVAFTAPGPVYAGGGTPLTLSQAVRIALERNPERKVVLADGHAAAAGIREAQAALFPQLSFSEDGLRSNDPVFVFGALLRQHRFGLEDFALNRLNAPTPVGNFATQLAGSWNVFDSFRTRHNIQRARYLREAAGHELKQTDQELALRVMETYYGVLVAGKSLAVARQSVRTAQSILDRSQARFKAGVVVQSDLLTAQVNLAERREQLIHARNDVKLAQARLNAAMGVSDDSIYDLRDTLEEQSLTLDPLPSLERRAIENRPDLKRLQSETAAQLKSLAVAKSAFGPRLNVIGDWESDNTTLIGNGGNNWLAGFELQVDLFDGGARKARLARERAGVERLSALRQAAEKAVQLEVRQAYYDADTASQQVQVAKSSLAQAQESLRINQNRYDAGLATITGLLQVEDAARRTQLDYWQAVCRTEVSSAKLQLATGTLNPPVVKP